MIRAALRRLEALEQKAPKHTGKWHRIIVDSDEEEERETAVLKASSEWKEGDHLMVVRLVSVADGRPA